MKNTLFPITKDEKNIILNLSPESLKHIEKHFIKIKSKYFIYREGVELFFNKTIYPILQDKNMTDICNFRNECINNVNTINDLIGLYNYLKYPYISILDILNKQIKFNELLKKANLINFEWLFTYAPQTQPVTGKGEVALFILLKDASNSTIGDVSIKDKIIEVKSDDGRLKGQKGFGRGVHVKKYFDEIMGRYFEIPKYPGAYNFTKNNFNYNQKIIEKINKINKYKEQLLIKENKMLEAKKNKKAPRKYENVKGVYYRCKANNKKQIEKLNKEILDLKKEGKENWYLEKFSKVMIKTKKLSLNEIISIIANGFLKLYNNANIEDIEKFIRISINEDGSFNKDQFMKEHFIFAFNYYRSLEKFEYFSLLNHKSLIIIDSLKFKNYYNYFNIKSSPSFAETGGDQGMAFAIELKNK